MYEQHTAQSVLWCQRIVNPGIREGGNGPVVMKSRESVPACHLHTDTSTLTPWKHILVTFNESLGIQLPKLLGKLYSQVMVG